MSEEVIRTTSGCNEAMMGSLLGSMANRSNNDPMAMAAMMNNSQWMNNPFIYLVFLMMFGRNGLWGNNENGLQDSEIQAKLNQLSTQMQDGNNTNLLMDAVKGNNSALQTLSANLNCDFNQLQSAVNNVQSAIQQVGGAVGYSAEKVINAANLGDMNIVQQLKDCCCQTQQNIIKMGYDNQLGQKDIQNAMQQGFSYTNTGLERGFSNIGYTLAQGFCDIKNAGTANTQRIVDVLNNHWQEDLQLRLNRAEMELSQQRQNATLIAALKTTSTTTTATT
jgi:hypothetical protein